MNLRQALTEKLLVVVACGVIVMAVVASSAIYLGAGYVIWRFVANF